MSTPARVLMSALMLLRADSLVHDSDTSSVDQIRDTLKTLRSSIRDSGFKASSLSTERQQWCDQTLAENTKKAKSAAAALEHLRTDLKDHDAAVQESEGTVEQLNTNIASAALLANQTSGVLSAFNKDKSTISGSSLSVQKKEHVLKTMVQNRQQNLASLKSELQLVQPVLAQLRSRAAETKRRVLDRDATVASLANFGRAISAACDQATNHSIEGESDRTVVDKSVEKALKAMELIDNAPNHRSAMKTLEEVSFVQVAESEQDDLDAIFGGDAQSSGIITQAPLVTPDDVKVVDHGVPKRPVALVTKKVHDIKTVRPQIQKLLTELKQKTESTDTAQKEWCETQKATNAIVLSTAQAELKKSAADINAHQDAETQLTSVSQQLNKETADVNTTANGLLGGVAKENSLSAAAAKDEKLATRILTQAIAILSDLQSSDLPGKSEKGAEKAVAALNSAKSAFQKQAKASVGLRRELDETAESVRVAARACVAALQQERMNVDMSVDNHASEREREADRNRGFEDEVDEAQTYLKKLDDECSSELSNMKDQERAQEMSALKDAETVLDGQSIHDVQAKHGAKSSHASNGLRGAKVSAHLSPMERAAQEMGVSVDDDSA